MVKSLQITGDALITARETRIYAGESISLDEVLSLRSSLTLFPPQLVRELHSFAERNAIDVKPGLGKSIKQVCLRCLKAFALVKIKEFKMPPKQSFLLLNHFQCNMGHNNYYLDEARVMRLEVNDGALQARSH